MTTSTGAQEVALGTAPGRGSRGCAMVMAFIIGLLVLGSAIVIAIKGDQGAGRYGVALTLLAFAYVMAVGVRHFAQKVFASRVRIDQSTVEIRRPMRRRQRVPLQRIVDAAGGVQNIRVKVGHGVGTEAVDVLQIHLDNGETVSVYAPDAQLRQQAADAIRARLPHRSS